MTAEQRRGHLPHCRRLSASSEVWPRSCRSRLLRGPALPAERSSGRGLGGTHRASWPPAAPPRQDTKPGALGGRAVISRTAVRDQMPYALNKLSLASPPGQVLLGVYYLPTRTGSEAKPSNNFFWGGAPSASGSIEYCTNWLIRWEKRT